MTPLQLAIYKRKSELVRLLVKSGVDAYSDNEWLLAKRLGYQEIADLLPPGFNDAFLVDVLKFLGYAFSRKGVCLGFAHIAKHAIYFDDIDKFNARLVLLANTYFDALDKTLTENNISRSACLLNQTPASFKIKFKENFLGQVRRLQNYIDIIALCDALYLYHIHPNYSHIYPDKSLPNCSYAAQQTMALLMSGEIEYHTEFSGVYSQLALQSYINILAEKIDQQSFHRPVSMILTTGEHALSISYVAFSHKWILADSATMPLREISNSEDLANYIMRSIEKNDACIFKSSLYAAISDRSEIENVLAVLKQDLAWQNLHMITDEKLAKRAGEKHSYGLEDICSTAELIKIQSVKAANRSSIANQLTHFPTSCLNRMSVFARQSTTGKNEKCEERNRLRFGGETL